MNNLFLIVFNREVEQKSLQVPKKKIIHASIIYRYTLTTEADASLLPPYSMPANIPTTVAVPQLGIPAILGIS